MGRKPSHEEQREVEKPITDIVTFTQFALQYLLRKLPKYREPAIMASSNATKYENCEVISSHESFESIYQLVKSLL